MSEDPIRDGLNWYTYCNGNPVRFFDPDGLAQRDICELNTDIFGRYYPPAGYDQKIEINMPALHGLLDTAGLTPVVGNAADVFNAAAYLGEGDISMAMMSLLMLIPLGNYVKSAKYAKYLDDIPLLSGAGKYADEATGIAKGAGSKLFKSQELLDSHYVKHGSEIQKALGESSYSITNYLDDANFIIKNGTYAPELNGYVRFMGGQKYGFVGLDRATGNITTFHIKTVSELIKNAPSLGLGK